MARLFGTVIGLSVVFLLFSCASQKMVENKPSPKFQGMVLARDVRMKTGAFVMAADTCLDTNSIEKLKRYHELGNISDKVFIRK